MKHYASSSFWKNYDILPEQTRKQADASFRLLKDNPSHPSLHFKKIGKFRSVRISVFYRALAVEIDEGFAWFWIGTHDDYKNLLRSMK